MTTILLALLAACTKEAPEPAEGRLVQVVATDYTFDPATIEAQPGEALTVELRNDGANPHNIEFELPDGEAEVEQDVEPGATGEVRFWAPLQDGEYVYYCPVGDHRDRGMEGRLVVGEGGGGPI